MVGLGVALAVAAGGLPAGGAAAESSAERGDYLVNTVMACGNCHTPVGPNGPMMERALSGGLRFETPDFTVHAPNITQDAATGIGGWSDAEIKRAIVEGVRPDGALLAPVMPTTFYQVLTGDDLDAIVAYLRTVPAVEATTPPRSFSALPEAHPFPGAEAPIPEAERAADVVRNGFYLATIAHCMECHVAWTPTGPDPVNGLGAGGREFPGPWGVSVASNITSHPEHGLGGWSDEEIARAITTGVSRDGSRLKPPMGFGYYAGMTPEDVGAIVAWLRTLPPR
ncbi:c-type cytochrome [Acuticoccus sp. 2012]|uniref:C-type cytochrome n=2 Tax=Acuticoccus mangrovi TaxID=2796142 RepID=A0A934IRJ3_9HYPH|nr:c-type cytochrome [Acuticoccus mangrovi]